MPSNNVVPIGRAAARKIAEQVVQPDDMVDTSAARMKVVERDFKAVAMGGSLFDQQERRAAMAMAAIEWEAHRLAALIGIAPAVEEIQRRVIARLIEGIQP